jgi:hypothetical protein
MATLRSIRDWIWKHHLALVGLTLFILVVFWCPDTERLGALGAFVWPTTIVVCSLLFRDAITGLISRVERAGRDGFHFRTGKEVSTDGMVKPTVNWPGGSDGSTPGEPSDGDGGNPPTGPGSQPTQTPRALSAQATEILATLWHGQQHALKDPEGTRWFMVIPPGSPDWETYVVGATELIRLGIAIALPPDWRTLLTTNGVEFCRRHQTALQLAPRIESSRFTARPV